MTLRTPAALLSLILAATALTQAHAGVIDQPTGRGAFELDAGEFNPIQTFTAIDTTITQLGFGFVDFDPKPGLALATIYLLRGDGFAGNVIALKTISVSRDIAYDPDNVPMDVFDFSATGLTIGATYTLEIAAQPGLDIGVDSSHNYYTGGHFNFSNPDEDLIFRVIGKTPVVSASGGVPEPASWALMIAGFGGVGAALRRRARVVIA
jgi:hypothetical protein